MLKYTLKRILLLVPVVIGITFLVYLVLSVSPGDPARMMLPEDATEAIVAAKREELGLNDPIVVQYLRYMGNAIQGNFGTSWYQGFDVLSEFSHRLPYTLTLATIATLVAVLIGIPAGVYSAVRHNHMPDYIITFFSLLLSAAPTFWLGMMYQLLFSLRLGWLPASGASNWKCFVLPVVSLAGGMLAGNSRMTRTWLLDIIRSDYVRTARAKGNKETVVIFKHALRNALLPVITQIGVGFSNIVGGSLVAENVYAFPGIGSFLSSAVKSKDIPIVVGCIVVVSIIVGITNLIVDLLYAVVDPRVQLGK
ncbi:MAG: ABC transporter permease [Eubacteriales bacterium]|nr:ABC transporter permease [Eubacteriales bacterium]